MTENTEQIYSKKMSINKINLQKWIDTGNTILPICINNGCNNNVAIRHWSIQCDPSLKTECTKCSCARKKIKIFKGLLFIKKSFAKIKIIY